jgi:hypothetical protein
MEAAHRRTAGNREFQDPAHDVVVDFFSNSRKPRQVLGTTEVDLQAGETLFENGVRFGPFS